MTKDHAPVDVAEYLSGPEDLRRRELVWGVVREPPAPRYGHQSVVARITVLLSLHVREHRLGKVCVSPADVVLDEKKALVVQPDVFFISNERADIVRDQVWGAPDLVVEVASRGTKLYDRTTKILWYREYGVRECWLVDLMGEVAVVNLQAQGRRAWKRFTGAERVASNVLPAFAVEASEFFN